MKPLFHVIQYGYRPIDDPVPLPDARRILVESARREARRCKARFGESHYHRMSPDCVRITLAPDLQSTMWAHFSIVQA